MAHHQNGRGHELRVGKEKALDEEELSDFSRTIEEMPQLRMRLLLKGIEWTLTSDMLCIITIEDRSESSVA